MSPTSISSSDARLLGDAGSYQGNHVGTTDDREATAGIDKSYEAVRTNGISDRGLLQRR